MSVAYRIRPLTRADEPALWEMLYYAIHVPPGSEPPLRSILEVPEIARYVQGWGRPGDEGLAAELTDSNQIIGAAWLRRLTAEAPGYGYIDDATPELSIAVAPPFRGQGIGARLLAGLLALAQERYAAVSLSVSVDNPALRLYRRLGFEVVRQTGSALTMCKRFALPASSPTDPVSPMPRSATGG